MLYTGKGDSGTTKLFSSGPGIRHSKTDPVFEALGSLDELNSLLGLIRSQYKDISITIPRKIYLSILISGVQEALFVIQAELAGAPKRLKKATVKEMEALINSIEKQLPVIKTFTISGEHVISAWCDYARAVSRRVERAVLRYKENSGRLSEVSCTYLNRLSSLLYALARITAYQKDAVEKAPTYEHSIKRKKTPTIT